MFNESIEQKQKNIFTINLYYSFGKGDNSCGEI
jgi:hypothetical protein